MTRLNWWLWAGALLLASAAHAITVGGYALCWGSGDQSGTRVLLLARSPSAVTDSVFTDAEGYFTLALSPGVYDVHYSHAGYADYPLLNQALLFDTTLDTVWLLPPLSGYLSGDLGPGSFQVTDTIFVGQRAYLSILPGTRLYFDGPHPFIVNGILEAVGTAEDSIVFTRRYPTDASRWGGIRFVDNPSGDACRMEYCVVEQALRQSSSQEGAALYVADCSPTFSHSTVRWTQGYYSAGLWAQNANIIISDCDFVDNYGVAVLAESCDSLFLRNVSVHRNSSFYRGAAAAFYSSSVELEGCNISQNTTGGCVFSYCHGAMRDCSILDNSAYGYVGGVRFSQCVVTVTNCVIARNLLSDGAGAGISLGNSEFLLERCVIVNNRSSYPSGGLYASGSSGEIRNCTFSGNTSTSRPSAIGLSYTVATITSCIVAHSEQGTAFYFRRSPTSFIQYCDIFGFANGVAQNYDTIEVHAPAALGIVAFTNFNGDSCDTYYNIFLDPQFVDTAVGDYHLTAGSPCIDAGDPALDPDPDGTVADMGAFYYHQLAAREERTAVRHYQLAQNYPNPFNAQTRIAFELLQAGEARLDVFDVTGRFVQTLARGPMSAGSHEVLFNARDLPSGVYFARLSAGEFVATRKLLLVR